MSNAVITATFREGQLNERINIPLNQSHIVLLISAGRKKAYVHEERHLEATFDLINACHPKKVTIVVAGKLQRHSFWNTQLYNKWSKYSADQLRKVLSSSADILEQEAVARGPAWLNKNEQIIKSRLKCSKIAFMTWQAILDSENYQENYRIIKQLFDSDEHYRKVADTSIEGYLAHHQKDIKNADHREVAREMCTKYLLEECPLVLPSTLSSDYTIYHNEPNELMQETYSHLFPGIPLRWFSMHYQFNPEGAVRGNQLIGISSHIHSRRQEKKEREANHRNQYLAEAV